MAYYEVRENEYSGILIAELLDHDFFLLAMVLNCQVHGLQISNAIPFDLVELTEMIFYW